MNTSAPPLARARKRPAHRTARLFSLVFTVLALVVSGCAGQNGASSGENGNQTLNIGSQYTPNTFDPAQINKAYNWYVNLAYDPLIYWAPDGSLKPRLAESWNYSGSGNTVFELHLRQGVKFSDGTPLTAAVVKDNIDYFRRSGQQAAPYLKPISTIETPDPLTVRIMLSSPVPTMPELFTQDYWVGYVVSGDALRQPEKLATQTFGAGPYMLDPGRTVAGNHYTYVPNPNYWDKNSVHYGSVVVKVLPNSNTRLSALKTGQVDVIQGDYGTVSAAKSAGLQIANTPLIFQGLALADRAGKLSPPLGDVRVRQALNYAVDRDAIAKGLYGDYGTPTEQIVLPGEDGYNSTNIYSYNPDKARQLLAEAGYPNGFTLPVVTSQNTVKVTEAIADYLKAVGVQLQITDNGPNSNKYLQDMASGRFPAYGMAYGTKPVYIMGPGLFLPSATQFNPLRSSDPQIQSWYDQAAAVDPAGQAELNRKIVARIDEQGWFVPVVFVPNFFFSRAGVTGVQITPQRPFTDVTEWRPAP